MVRRFLLLGLIALAACSSSDDEVGDACNPADQDGVVGGTFALDVTITDTGFTPTVVQVQNSSTVTLTVHNTGTKAHSFAVDCLTKNGCSSCFPAASKVGPLAPGASATATFTAPSFEGLYTTRSDGDTFTGQFSLN
jgi:hypothetical protein